MKTVTIKFTGPEASGKTLLVELLKKQFSKMGITPIMTPEARCSEYGAHQIEIHALNEDQIQNLLNLTRLT